MSARARMSLAAAIASGAVMIGPHVGPVAAVEPAETATASNAEAGCKWEVDEAPYKKDGQARKKVIVRNCTGTYKYWLQRGRWWGWENIDETPEVGSPYETVLKAGCRGHTYTYRVYGEAYFGGHLLDTDSSPEKRFSC